MGMRESSVAGLILIVMILQILTGLGLHSPLLQISTATSLLAIISINERVFHHTCNSSALLYRAASLVVFVAMLFINLSHCLEELTDFGNHADEEGNHTHHSLLDHYNVPSFQRYIIVFDFFVKFCFCFLIPPLTMPTRLRTVMIMLTPPISWAGILYYEQEKMSIFGSWVDDHMEPLVGVLLTILSYTIAIPAILSLKPYLLADSPPIAEFDATEFQRIVKEKVPALESISHVHASREWPVGFKVTMKAEIRIVKSDPDWVRNAAVSFEQCKLQFHTLIKKAGANDVVIEPVFIDPSEETDERNHAICIDRTCHSKDVGCCTVRKEEEPSHCDHPV